MGGKSFPGLLRCGFHLSRLSLDLNQVMSRTQMLKVRLKRRGQKQTMTFVFGCERLSLNVALESEGAAARLR